MNNLKNRANAGDTGHPGVGGVDGRHLQKKEIMHAAMFDKFERELREQSINTAWWWCGGRGGGKPSPAPSPSPSPSTNLTVTTVIAGQVKPIRTTVEQP